MRNIYFLDPAEEEMLNAAIFYEAQAHNLGKDFLRIIEITLHDISKNPLRWSIVNYGIRRRLIKRFPYSILYKLNGNHIIIVAIMHLHRRPNYWIERL
ncbi:MAG: type II toxin-antitoxin system RelE/ParE family toxin [Candidatus Firestonebacteria bacterium]